MNTGVPNSHDGHEEQEAYSSQFDEHGKQSSGTKRLVQRPAMLRITAMTTGPFYVKESTTRAQVRRIPVRVQQALLNPGNMWIKLQDQAPKTLHTRPRRTLEEPRRSKLQTGLNLNCIEKPRLEAGKLQIGSGSLGRRRRNGGKANQPGIAIETSPIHRAGLDGTVSGCTKQVFGVGRTARA